jgi:hypothetical protein
MSTGYVTVFGGLIEYYLHQLGDIPGACLPLYVTTDVWIIIGNPNGSAKSRCLQLWVVYVIARLCQ